jgi:hypothetical protein
MAVTWIGVDIDVFLSAGRRYLQLIVVVSDAAFAATYLSQEKGFWYRPCALLGRPLPCPTLT